MLYCCFLYIRAALFNIGYFGSGVIFGTLSSLIWPLLPYPQRYRLINQWNRFVMLWLRLCCGVRIEMRGHVHKERQPYVIMSKHQCVWETLYLQLLFQPMSTILKKELLRIPFFGWGLAALKPIAIDRRNKTKALREVKTKGVQALNNGNSVLIFPEGTRTLPGEVVNYARSGADIACAAGRPVIPVAHNAAECWPHKQFLKYPGTITIVIGEPIDSDGKDRKQLTEEVKEWIETTAAQLPAGRRDGQRPWLKE
ncbi:lysophospholipid acyltransferase family protein [Marinimicrobium sp. ARAG 43.8]|uniref:lysophospholipid acyltransferase family protein n=1 Tax=Marinimicrobium sp. ARAG 43.8 TaxID=3418719 RepID=UPI003CF859CF